MLIGRSIPFSHCSSLFSVGPLVLRCFIIVQRVFLSTSSSDMHLIINAVGKDRLGIVSDVTGMVIDAGGNVGDSQASKLGSHFSLMMEVTLPRDRIDSLQSQLSSMADMNATVYQDQEASSAKTPQIGCKCCLVIDLRPVRGLHFSMRKVFTALECYAAAWRNIYGTISPLFSFFLFCSFKS